jgi:addiction module HigA family antidote
MGLRPYQRATGISVHPRRINEIVHGNRAITADTALRLSRFFGMSETFWMNLQSHYDLEVQKDKLSGRLEREVVVHAQAG